MAHPVYNKVSLKLLPLLVVIYLFAYIDRTIVGFAKLQMGADIGLSATAFGLGAGLFFIAYTLCEVPSNLLMVKFGARMWFARIMISWGVVTVAMAWTQGANSFYILRFLLGVAEAGFYPGILYLITQWYPPSVRGRIVGLFLLANPLALAIGSPISGWILEMNGYAGLEGWQWLFILMGIPPILLAFVVLKYLPNRPSEAKWLSDDERRQIELDIEKEETQNGSRTASKLSAPPLSALADKRILLLSAFFLCYPLTGYGLSLWLPSIVADFGTSTSMTGLLSSLPWLAAALALVIVPKRAEKRKNPFAHIAGTLIIAAVGLASSVTLTDPVWRMVALCVAAFGIFAGQPIFWSLPSRLVTGVKAAAGLAFVNSIGSIGGFVGPYGVGLVTDMTGSKEFGVLFLAVWPIYGLMMLILVKRMMLAQKKTHQLDTELADQKPQGTPTHS